MRDELIPGKKLAAYWIEYVLRHGSTNHLKVNSRNNPFYKRYFLDAGAVLLIALLTLISIFFYIMHKITSIVAF